MSTLCQAWNKINIPSLWQHRGIIKGRRYGLYYKSIILMQKKHNKKIKPVPIQTLKPKYKSQLYHSNRQAKNIPPHSSACNKPRPRFPTSYVVCMLHEWRWEVIVLFADIWRNVHHHCLNFFFTINNRYFRYY